MFLYEFHIDFYSNTNITIYCIKDTNYNLYILHNNIACCIISNLSFYILNNKIEYEEKIIYY